MPTFKIDEIETHQPNETFPDQSVDVSSIQKQSGFGETVGAWWTPENTIGSLFSGPSINEPDKFQIDAAFFPTEDARVKDNYNYRDEESMDAISKARNKDHLDSILNRIDWEKKQQQVIANGGTLANGIGMVSSILIDPITAIPVIGLGAKIGKAYKGVKAVEALTNMGKAGAGLVSAMEWGAYGALDAAAREAILQPTQLLRTTEQTAINIGTGGLTGGVLGGVVGAIAGKSKAVVKPELVPVDLPNAKVSGGAAATQGVDLTTGVPYEMTELVGGDIIRKLHPITPNQRLGTSTIPEARSAWQELAGAAMVTKGEQAGLAAVESIESKVTRLKNQLTHKLSQSLDMYKGFKKEVTASTASVSKYADELINLKLFREGDRAKILANPSKYVTKNIYANLVTKQAYVGNSPFKSLVDAADHIKENIWKPTGKELVRLGIITQEQLDAGSFTRAWNVDKIKAHPQPFKQMIADDVVRNNPGVTVWDEGQSPTEIAEDMYHKIINGESGANPFKHRTAIIESQHAHDFLETDIRTVMDNYINKSSTTIAFKERGYDRNFKEAFDRLDAGYEAAHAAAKTTKEADDLAKVYDRNKTDLQILVNRINGRSNVHSTDSYWRRQSAAARSYLASVMLPGMVVASIFADAGRLVSVYGLTPYLKNVTKYFLDPEFHKMVRAESGRIGFGLEHIIHSRVDSMMGIDRTLARDATMFEKGSNKLMRGMDYVTLMGHWNTFSKSIAGSLASDRLIEKIAKFDSLSKSDRTWFAHYGIGEAEFKAIKNQFDTFGSKIESYHMANVEDWVDKDAANIYDGFVQKVANETINTPTAGSLPVFMDNETGKFIMMFKSFVFASHEQTLIAGLQRHDANFFMSVSVMIALGAGKESLYRWWRDEDQLENPESYILAGLNQTGVLGWFGEGPVMADQLTGNVVSKGLGIEEAGRYRGKDPLDVLGGPGGNWLNNLGKTVHAAIDDSEWDSKDTHRLVRLAPFVNHPILQTLMKPIEQKYNQGMGIPEAD